MNLERTFCLVMRYQRADFILVYGLGCLMNGSAGLQLSAVVKMRFELCSDNATVETYSKFAVLLDQRNRTTVTS